MKLKTKSGWLTSYALACGYVERAENDNGKENTMHALLENARMDYLRRIRFYMAKFIREDNCTPEQARQWAVAVIEAEDADDCRREWKGPDDRAECITWV